MAPWTKMSQELKDHHETFTQRRRWLGLFLVLLIGLFFRLYSFHLDPVINPDGTLYIQQAKALYYGLTDSVTECYSYLSNYPLLIVLFYKAFGHWVIAASAVSIVFSIMTMIPLYLLLREFLDEPHSLLALLIFSVMPKFVGHSHSVIRGPVFWFFAAMGLFFFVKQMRGKKALYLVISCLFFLMATWARVEGLLFVMGSIVYLVFSPGSGKGKRLLFFTCPILVLGLFVFGYATFFKRDILRIIPFQSLMSRINGLAGRYNDLQKNLIVLENKWLPGFSPYFLRTVRRLVWLLALGSVVRQILRSFSYPFFLVFIVGLFGLKGKVARDPRLTYLVSLSAGAVGILYGQGIYNWAVQSRHTALLLIPSLVFMGFGVVRISDFLAARLKWRASIVHVALFIAIILVVLPFNLISGRGGNKFVWREIGRFIAAHEGNRKAVSVAGSFKRINLVHFYANEDFPGAPCFFQDSWLKDKALTPGLLRHKGFDYYLWDEESSSRDFLKKIEKESPANFVELGQWTSPKKGRIVLFRVKSSNTPLP